MSERAVHPAEYVRVFARRKMWFILPFAVCALGGVALAIFLPPTFRSSARIGIQTPTVAPDLVAARAGLDREERLRAVTQQLTSPVVLERVAREERLIAERPIEQVVQGLMGNIKVEVPAPIARTQREPELNAFDIVYRDRSAERAQKIANRLAQVFVDEHSRSREVQAEGTAEFLGEQLRAAQERMSDLDSRLRTAKERHIGNLPEQTVANLQTLSGVRTHLESTSQSLRSEQDRLSLLERHMQSLKEGQYSVASAATGLPTTPQQRVIALQRDLDLARAKYTPKHPEVQILEDELKTARAAAAAVKSQPESARQESLLADPAYQQLATERQQVLLRIRAFQRAETQLRADIARYQQRVEAAPMVEQELKSMEREYELERENYGKLSERHATALVQEQIARTRGGERFSVLNTAYLPHAPESPNRLRILLMALGLGAALGGAMVFGREFLDRSIRDPRKLQDEFDVPVLAEIPRIHGAA